MAADALVSNHSDDAWSILLLDQFDKNMDTSFKVKFPGFTMHF